MSNAIVYKLGMASGMVAMETFPRKLLSQGITHPAILFFKLIQLRGSFMIKLWERAVPTHTAFEDINCYILSLLVDKQRAKPNGYVNSAI